MTGAEIVFLSPGVLLLLAAIPALWFLPRRVDRPLHGILRSAVFALVIAALARPVLIAHGSEQQHVVIVDRSASLRGERSAEAGEALAGLIDGVRLRDRLTVIELGDSPPAGAEAPRGERLGVNRRGSESSLSAALAAAAQRFPAGVSGRIALISDGLATDRDWGSTVAGLIEREVAVDVYDLGARDDDLYPTALYPLDEFRVGDTAQLAVTVVGYGDINVVLTDGDGRERARAQATVDGRAEVPLSFEPESEGFMTLTVEVQSLAGQPDSGSGNNRLTAGVAVQPPIGLLYLGASGQEGVTHVRELLGAGFAVDTPDWPLDPELMIEGYELVVVDDVPASSLPEPLQQRVAAAVRERGLGLLFAGGRGAFGEGGYHATPVAAILPVEFPQRAEKTERSVALAIIIDSSGSMWGKPLELAKQMARLSLNELRRTDIVGVVEFYGNRNWAVPLQLMHSRTAVERAIGRLEPEGDTTLLPAIEEAYFGLKNLRATYKHILMITDAEVEDADFDGLVRSLARDGITLSTVYPGRDEDNAFLKRMARMGGGRFYAVPGQFHLVEIGFREPDEKRLPLYRDGDFPVVARTGAGWWGEAELTGLPALDGYVEVQNRRGADVLLETEGPGHPLLSSWRYGLGRVTALMTEPVGPGTRGWRDWDDYGRLLARVMRRTAADGRDFDYQLTRAGDTLYVDAVSVGPDGGRPALQIAGGPRAGENLDFAEMAPGWFRARVSVPAADDLRLRSPVSGHRLIASSSVSAEMQVDPLRGLDLARLAAVTGGIDLTRGAAPDPSVGSSSAGSMTVRNLSPWVLLLALLGYLGELLYRRWPAKA